MTVCLLSLVIGAIAGLRTMTPPAAICWFVYVGWLDVSGTWLASIGNFSWRVIVSVLAAGELIADKLPSTPSRKIPPAFAARVVSGALCGLAVGYDGDAPLAGLVAGAVGAVGGTLGGSAARARLATLFGKDAPAALLEDAVAIGGAIVIGGLLR